MCEECKEEKKIKSEKIRKVFLDDLPRRDGKCNRFYWAKSIGYKVPFIYDDIKGEIEILDFDGKDLYIKYLNNSPFKIYTSSFTQCMIGKLLGKVTKEFKIKIGDIFKDVKRDLVIIDRKYIKNEYGVKHKYYKYHCNKCGYEGLTEESSIINKKVGCACCCTPSKIVVQGINDIPTTAPWMIKYFQGGEREAKKYTKCSHIKIRPVCCICGKVAERFISIDKIYKQHSIKCNSCNDGISYPEKIMYSVLKQLGINFKTEYSPEWVKPKRYDFYMPDKNLIIEMDGGWHKRDNKMSGQTKEKSQIIDNYKNRLAEEHSIKVKRIDCEYSELDLIRKDIVLKLSNIFDLPKINWSECEKFALSNLCKKACEIKRDNPNMTALKIGEIMNLSRGTIVAYLKKGSKIWDWCEYNAKEECSKQGLKNGGHNKIQIEVFKDGISMGIFESSRYLDRESYNLFGIKLSYKHISSVANGKRKSHRGFTFKFVDKNNQQSA